MRVIAHRGASGEVPENTLPAFDEAWRQGADGVECDVRCSADGVVVVMHDACGTRTLGDTRAIAEVPFAELSECDAGSWMHAKWKDARVPDLRSVLRGVPAGREAVVELKAGLGLASAVARVADEFPCTDITWIAFDYELIREAKRLMPTRRALWLFGDYGRDGGGGSQLGRQLVKRVREGGLDGLDLGWSPQLDAELTAPIREAGIPIYAFTINDRRRLDDCCAAGVDAITTDFPGRMREMIFGGGQK